MNKLFSSIFALSTLLVPSLAVSQEESYTTEFNLISMIGSTVVRYPLSEQRQVVLPSGVNWTCKSVIPETAANGTVYQAGFVCTNANEDLFAVQAQCYAGREDYEKSTVVLSKQAAEVGTIKFIVECRTKSDSDTPTNPFLRRMNG